MKFVGFWHYGVILTYLSAASAIVGMILSVAGYPFYGGVVCLWISAVCDAYDGTVARTRKNRTQDDKMFGSKIDSLSDVIAFGVAPTLVGYGMGMHEWYFMIPFALFVISAICRLAHFDVEEDKRLQDPNAGRRTSCEGLPVIASAIGVPVFYLVALMFRNLEGLLGTLLPKLILCFCYLLIAVLMILKFRMPKLGVKGVSISIAVVTAISLALLLVNIFVIDGSINYVFPDI